MDSPVHWDAAGALQERRVAMFLVWETWPGKTINLSQFLHNKVQNKSLCIFYLLFIPMNEIL